jgi:Fungal specific transcription factor domain
MRLALQQGYHRDPSHFPNVSVFQGEMRRRIWSAVSQHDLLFSVLIGLPKCIRYAECDTQSPGNFHEEELYEDMKELPPSRPVTEDTEISYQVVKLQVMRAYGSVMEFLNLLQPQPYEEVLKLDLKLMEAKANIPPHLQLRTLEEMANDPPSRVMERFIPQLFYNKAQCLLHRKHWDSVPSQTSPDTWYYSRKSCVNSALGLLDHQATMHHAAQPGGLLEKMKWYHFPITNHDFLLAAMILCLDIMSSIQRGDRPPIPGCFVTEAEKLQAIQRSRAIWAEVIDDCRDARRAVSILTSVLNKLSASREEQRVTANHLETKDILSASATNPNVDSLRYSPYFTDQFGLGIPLIASQPTGVDVNMETDFLDTLGSDLTAPGDFNWVSISIYILTIASNLCQRTFGIRQWLGTPNCQGKRIFPSSKCRRTACRSQKILLGHSPTTYIVALSVQRQLFEISPRSQNFLRLGQKLPSIRQHQSIG